MAELLFFRDGELQMRAPVRAPKVVLGRAAEADFVLPDRAVSRLQCEIVPRGQGHALVDLSGRGTAVSSRVASEGGTGLRDGDEIRLGSFLVLFSATSAQPGEEKTSPRKAQRGRTGPQPEASYLGARARLRVRRPSGEELVPLRAEDGYELVVGSDPEGEEQLELPGDRFVSAEHFRIAFRKGRWVLADLGSKNGTWVQGVRVTECQLHGRLQIRAGETNVLFEQDFAPGDVGEEPLPGLVSRDPAMVPVVEFVRRYAPQKLNVLVHGETGSGKEVIARALHLLSERRDGPFVAINCGAIARETAESELFGHEKGAFTGADRARAGAFEEAHRGTLFLDEVGDLPLNLQVKLLRALERGEVRRLGSSRTDLVDVRVVCATHKDIWAMVEDGSFREDLYYRLCVAHVELPPLRQRVADIVPLAEHFVAQFLPGATRVALSAAARAKLESHAWPGNARELRNAVQLALVARNGNVITDEEITFRPAAKRRKGADTLKLSGRTMDEIEREAYRLALERHDGDKKAAMEELGIAKSTFFRKLQEFGLTRDD